MRNWKKMLTKDANILLKSLVIEGAAHGPRFVLPEWGGFTNHLWIWKNGEAGIHYLYKDLEAFSKIVRDKALTDQTFAVRYRAESKQRCDDGVAEISKLSQKVKPGLTSAELNELFVGFCNQFRQLTQTIVMTLEELDAEVLQGVGNDHDLASLVTPKELSIEAEEELDRINIGLEILQNYRSFFLQDSNIIQQKLVDSGELLQKITNHVQTYGWIPLNFAQPLWDVAFFINLFKKYAEELPNLAERKKELETYTARQAQGRAMVYARLDTKTKTLADMLEAASYIRFYRATMFSKAFYEAFPLLTEVAKRVGVSFRVLPYFTNQEIQHALATSEKLSEAQGLQRKEIFVIRILGGVYEQFDGAAAACVAEDEMPTQNFVGVTSVTGRTAFSGIVRGTVRIIRDAREMDRVNVGDILVCKETNPNIVIAMARAGAIVTDEGGVTSHAAIVSREMKKPCVIGTKIATKIFKDGDEVEVDAEKGKVRLIKY